MGKVLRDAIRHNVGFWFFAIIAAGLLITSFLLPPQGEIHPSVIAAAGEAFAFAALWTVVKAIDRGHSAKITKGDTSLEVKKED